MAKPTRKLALGGTAAILALVSGSAYAQAASPTDTHSTNNQTAAQPDSTSGQRAGDVVVTARRSSERLRDVPSSVNVTTGDQIAAIGPVLSTADVLSRTPGVRFNNLQNPLLSEVTIRGSGSGRASGADPSVGLFANGVFVGGGGGFGRNFSLVDSFDLERAEVLSGPQGALYGRNAEYGVVNLVSRLPQFRTEGFVDDTYLFQTGSNRATAIVNYPLSSTLAVRAGAQYISQSKGFVFNPDRNEYFDVTKGWMGRASVRWHPGKLDASLLYSFERLTLPAYQQVAFIEPGTIAQFPLGFKQDRYSIPIDNANRSFEDVDSIVLNANYDLGWGQLSSSTSYRRRNGGGIRGFTNTTIDLATLRQVWALGEPGAYPLSGVDQATETKMYYQDLHLSGKALDDRLSWLLGAEALHFDINSGNKQIQDPCATAAKPNLTVNQGICTGTPAAPQCILLNSNSVPCPTPFPSAFGFNTVGRGKYTSWATYASLSLKVTPKLTAIGDIRYTNDSKDQNVQFLNLYTDAPRTFATGGSVPNSVNSYRKDIVTWTGTLNYRFGGPSDVLIYAKVGTGYRAGDFNAAATPPLVNGLLGGKAPPPGYAPVLPTYDAETIISYEAGIKGNVTHHVFATLTGYISKQKNALAVVNDGCALNNACITNAANYVVNAGGVRAKGVEATFDGRWDMGAGRFTLQLTASRQWAKYVDVPLTRPGLAAGQATGLPLEGSPVAQNPDWLFSQTVGITQPIGQAELFANVVASTQWGGIQDPVLAGFPGIPLYSFTNVNLRAGIRINALELSVLVNNLTDDTHIMLVAANRSTLPQYPYLTTAFRYASPRTVGVSARYKF